MTMPEWLQVLVWMAPPLRYQLAAALTTLAAWAYSRGGAR
jgi:hypothetical protein